jgi:hypothetical protein
MLVRELINDSDWIPSKDYETSKPPVSVLLPTYQKCKGGMFLQAARSILSQTYKDLELIIIDDGSATDSKVQIDALMQNDDRVSCIRHRHPIGLPAISEYEGFVKSRGKYLAFSSTNTVLEKTGIDALYKHLHSNESDFVYGRVRTLSPDLLTGKLMKAQLGTSLHPQSAIRLKNKLSHCAVLLRKELLYQVGLADPTPFMVQDCHWDLWIRIAEYYDLQFLDKHIATVQNLVIDDCLHDSYYSDSWSVSELMGKHRNTLLSPKNFQNYDIYTAPANLHERATRAITDCNNSHQRQFIQHLDQSTFATCNPTPHLEQDATRSRLLVSTAFYDASTSLCFDNPPSIAHVQIIESGDSRKTEVVQATALIIVREIFDRNNKIWIDIAKKTNVPIYWFIDDNFMVLSAESKEYSMYRPENVKQFMHLFAGVLASTKAIQQYFCDQKLHDNVLVYPPISTLPLKHRESAVPRKQNNSFRVLFFGGPHRLQSLKKFILPALEKLSSEIDVELVIGSKQPGIVTSNVVTIHHVSFESDYRLALSRFVDADIDVLVHPSTRTDNASYKTLNALINADKIGAALAVSDVPPFSEFHKAGIMAFAEDSVAAWLTILKELAHNNEKRGSLSQAASFYCKKHFDGTVNETSIARLLDKHRPPDTNEIDRRWRVLVRYLELNSRQTRSNRKNLFKNIERKYLRPFLKSIKKKLRD